jgi:hypothetical protein
MSNSYQKAQEKYRELAKRAAGGDQTAKADKAKAMNDIRAIERESARAGTVLSAVYRGDKVVVEKEHTDSKRDLQGEYIRKFDPEKRVIINGKETTLPEFHKKRLGR